MASTLLEQTRGGWRHGCHQIVPSVQVCGVQSRKPAVSSNIRRLLRLLCRVAGHEEIERLERLIVKDFQSEAKSHKEKLYQNHRVKQALESMQAQAERLVGPYDCGILQHASEDACSMRCCRRVLQRARLYALQLQVYEDADGSRKEEITSLKGEEPLQ
jgi:hypothetical protein